MTPAPVHMFIYTGRFHDMRGWEQEEQEQVVATLIFLFFFSVWVCPLGAKGQKHQL